MNEYKNKMNVFLHKLRSDKKLLAILILAVVGSFLLAISEVLPAAKKEKVKTTGENDVYLTEYTKTLEENLEAIISDISGAGKCRVMVTIDCAVEKVYAQNVKSEIESYEDKDIKNGTGEYIIIKSDAGTQSGLLITVVEPKIRGVAVVCEGGDSYLIKEAITDTVTALFSIRGNKVSVAKMKTNREE
ncbi:MAG TPA: hypothetical protein VFC76_07505 [Oscillospiraceae bacterium]|nr:hypothetical protein [Oscillospiraceae bacterium]